MQNHLQAMKVRELTPTEQPNELAHKQNPLREMALFAGAGGGILGGHLLGWECVCAVEWEPYPASVLIARQNEGILPPFPIWDDVRSFDGRPWRGIVDVVSGGFPCQDISIAGKGDGLDGERSGMWTEMARIIGEVQPRFAFVENSPMLTSRGIDRVLADLSALGYDAEWGVVGADDAGAPHRRERIWIVGYSNGKGLEGTHGDGCAPQWVQQEPLQRCEVGTDVSNPNGFGCEGRTDGRVQPAGSDVHAKPQGQHPIGQLANAESGRKSEHFAGRDKARRSGRNCWWDVEPGLGGVFDELADRMDLHGTPEPGSVPRVAAGIANRADRLKASGNGQVPAAVALAWTTLYERIQRRVNNE